MDAEKEISKINEEIREKEEQEMQLKHRLTREKMRAAYQKNRNSPEYKARTHRLCNKGGTVEHFYPNTKDMTEEEFFGLVEMTILIPEIRIKLMSEIAKILKRRKVSD
ncbi:MAG: DUF3847 domain-containing protein [Eubacterium sp.]|nr:DUF3847 domain-containing protein [Eubacterium sp.]